MLLITSEYEVIYIFTNPVYNLTSPCFEHTLQRYNDYALCL